MAVPSYTTDLVDISLGEAVLGWFEPTGATLGGTPALEADYYIQGGSSCISKAFAVLGLGGMAYNYSSEITIVSGEASFHWIYYAASNAIATLISGGYRILIGSSGLGNYKTWNVLGNDTYIYGGWQNIAVDPTVIAEVSYGTPTGATQIFGSAIYSINAVSKGQPMGNDAIRYGRELIIMNGQSGNSATFVGAATQNDLLANRWGLFQAVMGGYLQKGLFLMGTDATAVDFRDSNRNIFIQDTTKVASGFNEFEVKNSSSRVDWTGINIAALGTTSKGKFTTTNDADINFNNCTFIDMNTFVFMPNSMISATTFRRCGIVTQGGAIFTNCKFDNPSGTKAFVVDTIANITNTEFISDGTGYALEGFSSAASYTLTNLTFTGYAASNGTTGNEAIHVLATSGTVTLTISGGTTPSIHTEGATVNVVTGAVNTAVTIRTLAGVNISGARVLVLASTSGTGLMPYNFIVTQITRSDSTATVAHTAHGMATDDKVQIKGADQLAYNGVYSITKINNDSYSYTVSGTPDTPATGTIKATYAALSGLTDLSGFMTMSRSFGSSQPILGRIRKSTGIPIYKTSDFAGTIDKSIGFSTIVQMIPDE